MQSGLCTDCGMSKAEITKLLYSTTSQTRGTGWITAHKMVSDYLLFLFFTIFLPLPHGPKITRLNKIYISTSKSHLSEINVSPIWRITLGHLLLKTLAESPVCSTIITNNISSVIIYHMVVEFIFAPIHCDRGFTEIWKKTFLKNKKIKKI